MNLQERGGLSRATLSLFPGVAVNDEDVGCGTMSGLRDRPSSTKCPQKYLKCQFPVSESQEKSLYILHPMSHPLYHRDPHSDPPWTNYQEIPVSLYLTGNGVPHYQHIRVT
jgi:hypothetical protein